VYKEYEKIKDKLRVKDEEILRLKVYIGKLEENQEIKENNKWKKSGRSTKWRLLLEAHIMTGTQYLGQHSRYKTNSSSMSDRTVQRHSPDC
jgi:hypothetical protein